MTQTLDTKTAVLAVHECLQLRGKRTVAEHELYWDIHCALIMGWPDEYPRLLARWQALCAKREAPG